MLLIKDKKKPNKDPFEISEKGFQGLQRQFPNRYVIAGGAVKVTPQGIEVIPVQKVGNTTPPKPKREK